MEPSERLRAAIKDAGYTGPTDAWQANQRTFGGVISKDLLISNANGNRAISKRAAVLYAKAFGRTAGWYLYGEETPAPGDVPVASLVDVPRVSWVTAGELGDQEAVLDFSDYPVITMADLPAGRWIALKLEPDANSMNKISPPESTIFVNLDDKRLVPNACYVISDEQGRVTYKRYRPAERPQFQPASYDRVKPPKLEGAITVIGRVRRSIIDM